LSLEKEIDSVVKYYYEKDYFPSAVIKIFDEKNVLYEKSIGDANIDTMFDVASLTKIVTSTIILNLINEEKLYLDSTIGDIFESFAAYEKLKKIRSVTIEQLLTHRSGLIDWYPFYSEKGSFVEVLNIVVGKYDKVEGTLYSDINFMILGEVIKEITKMDLEDALKNYIKIPLKIENICYKPRRKTNIAPSSMGNIIEEKMCLDRNINFDGWRSNKKELIGEVNDGNSHYFFGGVAGHAGIFADVNSYSEIGKAYLTTQDELLIKSMDDYGEGRGLGWQLSDVYPEGCGHSGFTGTSIWISRRNHIAAVIFTNRLMGDWRNTNLNQFRRDMHNCVLRNLRRANQ